MNLKELKELIELISEKGFAEFEIERQGFRLRISRFKEQVAQYAQPAAPPAGASSPPVVRPEAKPGAGDAPQASGSAEAGAAPQAGGEAFAVSPEPVLYTIKSPIVGTFYRSSSPDSEPFVKIGDMVEQESVVCIIEAMKLMNEIQAEVSGEVAKIYVENGQPVEYGQPLFGIKV